MSILRYVNVIADESGVASDFNFNAIPSSLLAAEREEAKAEESLPHLKSGMHLLRT
ncbi:hypothetical protein T10_5661 [Trichinella papuae]|uniref:Uncharacterized protein n=1 Tax=Trichinella papuae TaxID=268474 RepID=A0A0V1LY25_9BILA|nr:hypothetical protein T10_5661 [Trichinella papuae]